MTFCSPESESLFRSGTAIRSARFNPKGVPALYLALAVMTAAQPGFRTSDRPFRAVLLRSRLRRCCGPAIQ
nr:MULTISPECIES: RES domain-containing protein [Mesorhizobium]